MQLRIFSGGRELPVSPFIGRFVGNICLAVVASLKAPIPDRSVLFEIGPETLAIEVDGRTVAMDSSQGFARTLVQDTIGGMLQHLKGIEPGKTARVEITLEGKP